MQIKQLAILTGLLYLVSPCSLAASTTRIAIDNQTKCTFFLDHFIADKGTQWSPPDNVPAHTSLGLLISLPDKDETSTWANRAELQYHAFCAGYPNPEYLRLTVYGQSDLVVRQQLIPGTLLTLSPDKPYIRWVEGGTTRIVIVPKIETVA